MLVGLAPFSGFAVELFRLDLGLLVSDSTLVELVQPWWAVESKKFFFICVTIC